jgi:hypothetical protein
MRSGFSGTPERALAPITSGVHLHHPVLVGEPNQPRREGSMAKTDHCSLKILHALKLL